MTKIEALVRPEALESVLDSIRELVDGLTVTEFASCSSRDVSVSYRGSAYSLNPPGVRIEMVTLSADAAEIIHRLQSRPDVQIFTQDVTDALRIRNGQCGVAGL